MPNDCIANFRKTYKLRHLILLFHIHKICEHYFEILMVHYRNILCLMQHNLDIANIYSYSGLVQNGIPIHNVFFLFKMHLVYLPMTPRRPVVATTQKFSFITSCNAFLISGYLEKCALGFCTAHNVCS